MLENFYNPLIDALVLCRSSGGNLTMKPWGNPEIEFA
jgi:hypothetical protein